MSPGNLRLRAGYPGYDRRTEARIKNYWDMHALNDNVIGNVADTLIDAYARVPVPVLLGPLSYLLLANAAQ